MTIQIIVLGGAGDMGSRAVEDLALQRDVARITIADRDLKAATRLAATVRSRGPTVDALEIDARNQDHLVRALRGYDVAASALGPFFLFEASLIRAAIEARTHYCSICDEWQPAEQVLDGLSGRAEDAGVQAITCLGASPGLTNLTVSQLCRSLDRVDRARIAVYLPLNAGGGAAALRHGLHIMTGDVATWRSGARTIVRACSERQVIDFPKVGRRATWNMGHAEPVTLPRTFATLQDVGFLMGFGKGAELVVGLARLGAFASPRRADAFTRLFDLLERSMEGRAVGQGALRVDVWGERDGRPAHALRCGTGQMREITGLSLSVGALMLGRGQVLTETGGVFAPEACLDPDLFLTEMASRGVTAYEDLALTRPSTG